VGENPKHEKGKGPFGGRRLLVLSAFVVLRMSMENDFVKKLEHLPCSQVPEDKDRDGTSRMIQCMKEEMDPMFPDPPTQANFRTFTDWVGSSQVPNLRGNRRLAGQLSNFCFGRAQSKAVASSAKPLFLMGLIFFTKKKIIFTRHHKCPYGFGRISAI
jgi:hypothetical protein